MKRPFTDKELTRLDYLIQTGYGWGRYALSVKNQGCITERQATALDEMYCKVYTKTEQNKTLRSRPSYKATYKRHMSDNEGWGEVYETADYGGYEQ